MIPKIIHYCWFGPKKMSKTEIKCIKSWKKFLPDYKLKLWNEKNSPIDVPFVKSALEAKKYAFAADYVRIWALNQYGGIYMDTDMLVLKNLDCFLNDNGFIGKENENTISAGIIGVKKNSIFIKKAMQLYNSLEFNVDNLQKISIPQNLTQIVKKLEKKQFPKIYSPEVFYSLPMEATIEGNFEYKKYLTKNSVAVHLWNASWLDELNEYRKQSKGIKAKLNKIAIKGYKIFREIFEQIFQFKYMSLEEEKQYLKFHEIKKYNEISTGNLDEDVKKTFEYLKNYKNDTYILHYTKPCIIDPDYGWAITENKQLLMHSVPNSYRTIEIGGKWGYTPKPERFLFIKNKGKYLHLDKAISINYTGNIGNNYYHFWDAAMGELCLLKQHGIDLSLPIIIPEITFNAPFFKQLRQILPNLAKLNWIVRKKDYIHCNEIILAKTMPSSKIHFALLSNWFNDIKPLTEEGKKIFLTRNKNRVRHLKNQEEIEKIVTEYNYEIIDTDNLSLEKTIALFKSTTKLITIHGAGNVNILFRYPREMSILEIFTPSWPDNGYIIMANELGYKYDAVFGSELDEESSFYLNPNKLKQKIEELEYTNN